MVITELRRTGAGNEPTPVVFRWDSSTHTSGQGDLTLTLKVNTKRWVPAGASIPVEQVLGVAWEPFQVEGEWRDTWAGKGFAKKTEIEFARLVGRTPLVRLQIDEESIVGLLTELTIRYRTRDTIGWRFTLSPHINEQVGDPRQSANVTPPKPVNVRVDEVADVFLSLTELASNAAALPVSGPAVSDSIGQLAELGDAVERAQASVRDGIGSDTQGKLLSLASTFRRVRGAAETIFLDIARQRDSLELAFDDALLILKFNEWSSGTLGLAAQTMGKAQLAEQDMKAKASRKPIAIHVAKRHESLDRIALRYTGSADNWHSLYEFNNLHSMVLEGGEEIMIPGRAS